MAIARFFYKCLGRLALMNAAALWAGCGNDVEKKESGADYVAEEILRHKPGLNSIHKKFLKEKMI